MMARRASVRLVCQACGDLCWVRTADGEPDACPTCAANAEAEWRTRRTAPENSRASASGSAVGGFYASPHRQGEQT